MNLQELYTQVLSDPLPPYDPRLEVAMTEDQYIAYQHNHGHTYYQFLNKLVRRVQPKKILELGTSIGRSSLFMMTALPETSSLVTVDIGSFLRSDLAGFAWDKRLTIVFGNDLEKSVFSQIGNGFDFLFIDSEHDIVHLNPEWEMYKKLLVDGAIVVMDDIKLNQGMIEFWDNLPYEKVDTGTDLHFSGFGLFRYTNHSLTNG